MFLLLIQMKTCESKTRTLASLLLLLTGITMFPAAAESLGTVIDAGEGVRHGEWYNLSVSDGLAASTVRAILQDRNGVIWFGTDEGVSRYDGATFVNFTTEDGLPHPQVWSLLEDHDGNLWIGTRNGLCRYDGHTFTTFGIEEGLPDTWVGALLQDPEGAIWVGTRDGLCRYADDHFVTYGAEDGLAQTEVRALQRSEDGALWVGTRRVLYRFDGRRFIPLTPEVPILTLKLASDGTLWIGGRVGVYRVEDDRVLPLSGPGAPRGNAWAVEETRDGDIWLAGREGVTRFDGDSYISYTSEDGIENIKVRSMFEDREGLLWIGTRGGLSRYDGQFFFGFTERDGLAGNMVNAITRDEVGSIWIGTDNGLTRYHPEADTRSGRFTNFTTRDGLADKKIWSLAFAPSGDLWIGTSSGICRYDGTSFDTVAMADGLPGNQVRSLAFDHEGYLWVGTHLGLARVDIGSWARGAREGAIRGFDEVEPLRKGRVRGLLVERHGALWIATQFSGVFHYKGGTFTNYTTDDGLPNGWVSTIYEDPDGVIWFGTDAGASRFDPEPDAGENHFTNITTLDGLASSQVYGIRRDRAGTMWFATDGGLTRWDGFAFQSLLKRDGLPGAVTCLLLDDTGLWMGGPDGGLVHYRPHATAPTIVLSDVRTDRSLGPLDRVGLPSSQQSLQFSFYGTSYKTRTRAIQFRYRLTGYETDWRLTSARQVEYGNLPRGDYTFEVQAIDRDLQYSQEPARVHLTVHAPYVQIGQYGGAALSFLVICWLATQVIRRNRRLRATNEELIHEEARFRGLLEATPDGMLIVDSEGRIQLINEMLEHMFGYSSEELVGQPVEALLPERYRDGHVPLFQGFFGDLKPRAMGAGADLYGKSKEGTEFPVEISLNPQGSGEEAVVLASVRDVSVRKEREKKETALQLFRQDIWTLDTTSEIQDILTPLERTLNTVGIPHLVCGVNIVDESGDVPTAIHHDLMEGETWLIGEMRPESAQRIADRRRRGEIDYRPDLQVDDPYGEVSHEGVHQIRRRCVVDIPFSHGTLAFNSTEPNAFDGYLTIFQEIATVVSEGVQRLEDLRQLRERTEVAEAAQKEATLLHHSSEAAASTDSFEEVLQGSLDMVCEMTGWPIGHAYLPDSEAGLLQTTNIWHLEQKGDTLGDTLDDAHEEFREVTEQTTFAPGVGLPGRIWAKGEPAWIVNVQEDTNFPRNKLCREINIKGAFGFPIRVGETTIAILEFFSEEEMIEDSGLLRTLQAVGEQVGRVVERQQAQEALRAAMEEARQANESKSQFLANMSHEIRTPMNAILGFSEILGGIVEDPQQKRYLGSIQSSGKSLLGLINDILDLARVEAGKLNIEYEVFNAPAVFEDMKQIFGQKAAEKGIDLLVDVDQDLPPALILDETRLRQILINLIGNAIKFTDTGHVRVTAQHRYHGEGQSTMDLVFAVEDTGIGIPEDQLDKVFGAFEQTEGQSNSEYGGTGLGLAITRRLVELMNGKIGIESRVGEGSVFEVTFPGVAVAAIDELEALHEAADVAGLVFEPGTILVVDDVEANREVVTIHLSQMGFQTIEAGNGQEALALAHEHRPDLVLMDMRMPVLDGYAATTQLKADSEISDIPVVALTASAMEQDAEEIQTLCDGYLRKPVSGSDLMRELARFLPHTRDDDRPESVSSVESNAAIALEDDVLLRLPELAKLLESDYLAECQALRQTMLLTQIEDFAGKVKKLNEDFAYPPLSVWADLVIEQCRVFDLTALPNTLDGLEALADQINTRTQQQE